MMCASGEAKLIYLQERIRDAKRHEKEGHRTFVFGLAVSVVGFGSTPLTGFAGILMGIAGVGLAVIGIFEAFYYLSQYEKLMKELKQMTFSKCPKCGKELSERFKFCPFCGASLES